MSEGMGLALVAYLIWGLSPLYWKQLDDVAAGDVIAFRIVATFLVLLGVHVLRRTRRRILADRVSRRAAAFSAIAGLLLASNWLIYVWAVSSERILESSLGYFINPLVSVVLGVLILGERLRKVQWAAVAMASAGVVVLTIDVGTLPWVALTLAGTFGVYGLLRKMSSMGSLDGLSLEMSVLLPLALTVVAIRAAGGDGSVGVSVPYRDLLLLGTGIFTAVPLLLFASAARRIDLSLVGILQYIAPTLQFLVGVWIYDESWSGGQVVGYCIIWLALIVLAIDGIASGRRLDVAGEASAGDQVEGIVINDLSG